MTVVVQEKWENYHFLSNRVPPFFVRHRMGDHTDCGHSCIRAGEDLRDTPIWDEMVGKHGDPTQVDLWFTEETLNLLGREELLQELRRLDHPVTTKKHSTKNLRHMIAKLWGLK